MKKGIFSLMMGLILAFTGLVRANELTVNDGTETQRNTPVYTYYGDTQGSAAQFVVPADQLTAMYGAQITSMRFYINPTQTYNLSNVGGPTYAGYITEVSGTTMSSFIDFGTATQIFTGHVSLVNNNSELVIDFTTPYTYNGGNLAIAFTCTQSAGYASLYYYSVAATGGSIYRNSSSAAPTVVNYLPKTTFTYTGGAPQPALLSVNPDPVDLGARPNNCWMRPFVVELTNDGPATNITGIDFDNNYFMPELGELVIPFAIGHNETVEFAVTTGVGNGDMVSTLDIDYGDLRTAVLFDVMAYAYEPVEPDVWEKARVISNPEDYRDTPTTVTLYNNYVLPPADVEDGIDAVYKVTFDHDVMLNGNVVTVGGTDMAENGKMAIYTQAGIDAVGGPDLENNYTGPTIGSSEPMEMTVYPEGLTGTTTVGTLPMYGLYADAYTRSQYVIPATEIAQMAGCPINSLTYYASSTPEPWTGASFQVYLAEVSSTGVSSFIDPATATTVYSGELTVADNQMVVNFATPYQYNGGNLLIGMDCTTPGTYHSCYFQCVSMTGAGMYAYNYSAPTFTSPYAVNYVPTTTFGYMGRNANRDGNVLTYDFEDGNLQGWTSIDADGDGHEWMDCDYTCYAVDYAHTGSHSAVSASYDLCGEYGYIAFNANNYLVSPQKYAISEGSKLNFWFDDAGVTYSFPDYFEVCVSTAGNTSASDFTAVWNSGRTSSNGTRDGRGTRSYGTWREVEVDLSAYAGQEIYIAFHHQQYDGYDLWIDDVTIDLGGTPGPAPVPGDQLITNMTMVPGTYYIVASSTADAWDVILNASELPCPEAAYEPEPADDADGLDPSSVTLNWTLGQYTTEYRLVFGSTYYCENVLVDWTTDLRESYTVTGLFNNTNYFWRVDVRNGNCETLGEVWGFTTTFNAPTNLHSTNANGNNIYEGETLHLAWTPIVDRTFRSYNIYMDGDLIGTTPSNPDPNATTTFDVEDLAYEMGGHIFWVTAVYDEGESGPSNPLVIYVSGEGNVEGYVYEQDGVTGIAGATVTITNVDEFGRLHTYTFTTDANGYYTGAVLAGECGAVATCDGYQDEAYEDNPFEIVYNELTPDINFIMDEVFAPVSQVWAEYYPDPEDPESPYVKVYWGFAPSTMIEDFETGDFSRYEWNIPAQYPFEITTNNPYEGAYCMQSTNYNVASSTSSIDVTVEIPRDGLMSFYKRISCESSWDNAYFYMDGVQMATFTGTSGWGVKEVAVTEGTHNFKWEYTKDSSVDSGEDRFYIDYIDFIHDAQPVGAGWHTYLEGEFDNAYMSNVGTPSWGYEYPASVISSYAGMNMTKVALFSDDMYGAVGGTFTCNVYQGGATPAAGTLVSTITVDVPANVGDWVEFDLTTPVHVTNDPLYVLWTADVIGGLGYPAGCATHTSAYGDWWNPGDGSGWSHMGDCTWTMKNYFSDRSGRGFWASSENANQAIQPVSNLDSKLRTYAKGEEVNNGAACINPNATLKATANSNDRSLLYYRVYRTDCYNDGPYTPENTVVCCCELHDTLYIDVEWPELPAGVYKWGVGCVYGGNRGEEVESAITWANVAAPAVNPGAKLTRDGDYIYDFENDLEGWNVLDVNAAGGTWLHSDDNLQEQDYSVVAHSGTGFALCYSFVDYVGSFDTDSYMYSPQKYSITNNSTLTFWADNANDTYPENFSVCIATADNPTASDFTEIWNGGAKANNGAKAEVRHDGNRYDNWRQHTIDLSAYAGQNIYIAFHDVNYDAYEIWIDDVTITATGTPGPTPDPDPSDIQEPRESPIVWSNCLDKDMYLNGAVDITVLLNSADSPEGVNVSFTNLNEGEQELYPVAPVTLDGTGYYAWDTFRRGDYVLNITMGDAYEPITDTVSIWDATSLRYVMIEIIYGVNDLYVSHTGWAMWEGEGPVGPNPGPQGGGDTFEFGFDSGLDGWTNIDADGDGEVWYHSTQCESMHSVLAITSHSGAGHLCSESYCNATWMALNPNNFLVSPQMYNIANGSTLSFWACAQDASYAAEHFGVAISTTGNTSAADFTTIQEWTLTAKDGAKANPAATRNGEGNREGNWYQYTCDLSAYAGQQVWIAIRHFNVSDMFLMCLDDMTLTNGAKSDERHLEGYKVLCTSIDGEPIFSGNTVHPFIQVDTDELVEGENYICKVAAIYSTGMSDWTVAEWQYKSCENYAEAQNVAAEGQTVTWEYPGTPGPVPPTPGEGDEWIYDFDNSSMAGWTTIDADGDGYNWMVASSLMSGVAGHNGSADFVFSQSYDNSYGVLYPDNYLVSPLSTIAAGSTFSFWACGQDASYAAEHFGVAISTTGNTNASDFTTIYEHTIGAKGARYEGERGMRDQSAWMQYTVDLSEYAGQQVYIAIRHFNCSDEFYLDVDDVQLSSGAKSNRDEYIQYCTENYDGAVGTGGGQVWWANMYPATSLAAYAGQNITKIGQWVSDDDEYGNNYDGTYNVEVYVGGSTSAPGTLVASGSQFITGDNAWHDIELNTPVAIDGTQNIWVVFNANGIGYPMCGCAYVGEPNSDLLSLDGSVWEHAAGDYGLSYTWMIRAFVTGGSQPGPGPEPTGDVLGAMIFRDGEWLAEVAYPTSEYTDEEAYGEHEYCVRIIYNGTNVLPDQNEYYSMSCPVCVGGEATCAPGADIYGEYVWNNANDFGALITWGGSAPVPPTPGEGDEFTEGFESGSIPTGWTTIDADGDGHNWSPASVLMAGYLIPFHGGADCITSESYSSTYGALTPDNYLVSPQVTITNGSQFSFWACAQDPSYAGEHYGVAISTTGNTNAADFTTIAEWTMTAKDAAEAGAYMSKNGKGTREGTWYQKTVDLSDYAGQEVYIAIRHFNCTDMFYLNVDDAELSIGAKGNRAGIVKYNVYRSADNANYELIGSVDAVAGQEEYSYYDATAAGAYYYQVRADYGDCESEPALSGENPANNYVIVNVTSVAENGEVALYPNPTNGNVTIQAQNMNRITVVSVLGQVVYDAEVEGDSQIINMAQFNAGVYMVRIATENGVSTQRVTVVK